MKLFPTLRTLVLLLTFFFFELFESLLNLSYSLSTLGRNLLYTRTLFLKHVKIIIIIIIIITIIIDVIIIVIIVIIVSFLDGFMINILFNIDCNLLCGWGRKFLIFLHAFSYVLDYFSFLHFGDLAFD